MHVADAGGGIVASVGHNRFLFSGLVELSDGTWVGSGNNQMRCDRSIILENDMRLIGDGNNKMSVNGEFMVLAGNQFRNTEDGSAGQSSIQFGITVDSPLCVGNEGMLTTNGLIPVNTNPNSTANTEGV
jgi:hypothetical protein